MPLGTTVTRSALRPPSLPSLPSLLNLLSLLSSVTRCATPLLTVSTRRAPDSAKRSSERTTATTQPGAPVACEASDHTSAA